MDVAGCRIDVPMPDPRDGDASAYNDAATDAFLDYKTAQAEPHPSLAGNQSFAFKVFQAVNTLRTIGAAYGQCTPRRVFSVRAPIAAKTVVRNQLVSPHLSEVSSRDEKDLSL